MKLKSRIDNIDKKDVNEISIKYKLPEKIATLILSRIKKEDVENFIFPHIDTLFSPYEIESMSDVVEKIKYIKSNNKKVLIYGDYDVDGITSTSVMYLFFQQENINVDYYIPNRSNGYGLSKKSIDEAIEKFYPDVIITVDCGITSCDEVEYIKSKNIEIIITDHHTPQEILPNCLIVNPHIEKKLKFQDLCGVGVAFKVIQAYYKDDKTKYLKFLPIVAIGTIADVVPLIYDNRTMVQLGFSLINFLPKGIKKLLEILEINEKDVNSQLIAFKIAPILNSAGRLKSADMAVKLFISEDEEVEKLCVEIIETNKERQSITEQIFFEAEKQILSGQIPSVIVLKSENWDAGVIGIVASKILEKYKRTTILFTEKEGMLKGSCRSIDGINIFNELTKVSSHILQFGGHEKAAGLTIDVNEFENFKMALNKEISKSMKNIDNVTYYDLEILPEDVDIYFAKKLSILEPFGECNPSPTFLMDIDFPEIETMKKNDRHIMVKTKNLKIKYFNADKQILNYKSFKKSQNLVKVSTSLFNGYDYLNLICDNAIFFDLSNNEFNSEFQKNKYKVLENNLDFSQPKKCDIQEIMDKDNFIIVTYNKENFKLLEKIFKDKVTYSSGSVVMNEKRKNVCYCLQNLDELCIFENVYFCEKIFAEFVKFDRKTLIDYPFEDFTKLTIDRKTLVNCYIAIKNCASKKTIQNFGIIEDFDSDDMYYYFKNIYSDFNLTIEEYFLSLLIFEELKLIEYENSNLKMDFSKKCDLTSSKIYTTFAQ